MKSKPNETVEPAVALRHLADAIGYKWKRMLIEDCSGLGHIHDMWRDMYNDMECIVSLEKFICDNTEGVCGVDFLPTIGFPQYKVEKSEMTVAQLIKELQKMPQDAIVTMSNNDTFINGEYTVDFVEPYGDGTVEICTDYEKNLTYEE